jgi:hypothetical protein
LGVWKKWRTPLRTVVTVLDEQLWKEFMENSHLAAQCRLATLHMALTLKRLKTEACHVAINEREDLPSSKMMAMRLMANSF